MDDGEVVSGGPTGRLARPTTVQVTGSKFRLKEGARRVIFAYPKGSEPANGREGHDASAEHGQDRTPHGIGPRPAIRLVTRRTEKY